MKGPTVTKQPLHRTEYVSLAQSTQHTAHTGEQMCACGVCNSSQGFECIIQSVDSRLSSVLHKFSRPRCSMNGQASFREKITHKHTFDLILVKTVSPQECSRKMRKKPRRVEHPCSPSTGVPREFFPGPCFFGDDTQSCKLSVSSRQQILTSWPGQPGCL